MNELPPECARLAARLRLLREGSGLSLAALATESAYSKSSWQRYLVGRALPPWLAVRALCHLAGAPEPPVRALWELAEAAWSRRDAIAASTEATTAAPIVTAAAGTSGQGPAPAADADPRLPAREPHTMTVPEPAPRNWRQWRLALAIAALVTVLGVALAAAGAGNGGGPAHKTTGFHVGCTGVSCDGRDPGAVLCGVEPQTLLHVVTPTGAGIEIRYNPLCRAAWARVWNAPLGDVLTFTAPGRPPQHVTVTHGPHLDPFLYTPLAAVTSRASRLRACLTAVPGTAGVCYSAAAP